MCGRRARRDIPIRTARDAVAEVSEIAWGTRLADFASMAAVGTVRIGSMLVVLALGCSRGNLPSNNGTGGTGTAAGGRGGTVVSGGDAGTVGSAGAGGTVGSAGTGETVGGAGTGGTAGGAGGFSGTGGTYPPSTQALPGCVRDLMASCVQPSGCGYAPVDAGPIGSCNPDLARATSMTAQDAKGHWMRTLSVQNADGTPCYSFEKYENISRATGGTGGIGGSGSPGGAGGTGGAGGAAGAGGLPVNFCLGTCAYTWRDASGRVIATGTLMWGPSYASTMISCQLTDEKASCAPPSMMGDPMRCFVHDDGTASSGAPVVTCASGTCP